jgi:c-di-GMP-binding flagellar brake protein YcgR
LKRNSKVVKRFDLNRKLDINQRVDIIVPYGNYEGKYSSQVVDVKNSSIFTINTPFSEGEVINIPIGTKIDIMLRENTGLYQIPVKVIKREVEVTPLLIVELVGEVSKIQEREFFRLDIYQETEFRVVADNDDLINLNNFDEEAGLYNDLIRADNSHTYNAIIQDISASGLKMVTKDDSLVEGQILEIDFNFTNLPFDKILAKVVRVIVESKQDEKRYSIGVEFVHQNIVQRDKVIQWLFTKQRELRKKGLI